MSKIRALVVEDSLTARKRLVEVLSTQQDFEVIGEAEDGKQGIELCRTLKPDVVTLDMMMPVLDGLAATEYIMAYCPTPILIVSSSTNRGELFKTYEALAAGALDVLDKPLGTEPDAGWEKKLLATLRLISRIKVITHPRGRLNQPRKTSGMAPPPKSGGGRIRAVAIGGSTGAPGAMLQILRDLPADFRLPILLVLHLGKTFGTAFAEWLNKESHLPVAYAVDGEILPPPGTGRLVMAPPDVHMVLKDGRLRLTNEAERFSCRPSVDVLFESVAREMGPAAVACLLTGMGRDGAQGLLAVRQAGGVTWAQDEATSVVFGMPREAILLGAAEKVLPLNNIGPTLAALAKEGAP